MNTFYFKIYESFINIFSISGGRFLERRRLEIPGSITVDGRSPEYYSLANIYIGAELHVYGRLFRITGADEAVLKYMEESEIHLPSICKDSLVKFFEDRAHQVNLGISEEEQHVKLPVA